MGKRVPVKCKAPPRMAGILCLLKQNKAPSCLGLIITYMFLNMDPVALAPITTHVETFAGEQAVTTAWADVGIPAEALDIRMGGHADINSPMGMLSHLLQFLRLSPRFASSLHAPVCSTWVPINLATSGRSLARPLGKSIVSSHVAAANKMVSRLVLMLWLLVSVGVCIVVEQPRGSLMEYHPRFQEFLRCNKMYRTSINMMDCLSDPMGG